MLSPEGIQAQTFSSQALGGYAPEAVAEHLRAVARAVRTLTTALQQAEQRWAHLEAQHSQLQTLLAPGIDTPHREQLEQAQARVRAIWDQIHALYQDQTRSAATDWLSLKLSALSDEASASALLLMDTQTAAMVLRTLPCGRQAQLIALIARPPRITLREAWETIAHLSLGPPERRRPPAIPPPDPAQAIAAILDHVDEAPWHQLRAALEQQDRPLSETLDRARMGFRELGRLGPAGLRRLLKEISQDQLLLALAEADPSLRETFFSVLSTRAAQALSEELEIIGSVPPERCRAARRSVLDTARELIRRGEIDRPRADPGPTAAPTD